MKGKVSSSIKIISINIFLLFCLLIIVDRIIPKITNQISGIERYVNIREHDPFSSYQVKADTTNVLINIDKNGFIIGDEEPNSDEIDYIFVGGSTTECFYVSENKRFPFLSIKLLNEKVGGNSYGFNAGLGGNNLMHSYIVLITKLLELKPKNIILMNAINDFSYLLSNEDYFKGPRAILNSNKISLFSFLKKIKDNLFPNIYRSIRSVLMINRLGQIPGGPDTGFGDKNFSYEKNLSDYSKILDLFIQTCKTYNINLILMTQFNYLQNVTPEEYLEYNKYNQKIREKSVLNNLKLIDLDSLIPKNLNIMSDGLHLNNKGSILVSKIIADHLYKNIIL